MKRLLNYLLFSILLLTLLPSSLFINPLRAQAATTDANVDLKRRQLHTFLTCISEDAVDWDDDIDKDDAIQDLLKDAWDDEVVVVGFDRDKGNGVLTCKAVIKQGAIAFAPSDLKSNPSDDDIENWFVKRLTGTNYSLNGGKTISKDKIKENRQKLEDEVKAVKDRIDEPNNALRQQRFLPLVDVCYTYEQNATKRKGDNDFEVPGVGIFYMKSADDIKSKIRSWDGVDINDGYGDETKVKIGDIELGWRWGVNNSFDSQFDKNKSDFYPIGNDVGQTNGYLKNAIVECEFVESNKDIIFEGVKIRNGVLVLNGNPLDNSAAPGTTTSAEEDQACESSGPFGWLICAGINLLSSAIDRYEQIIRDQLIVVTPGPEVENAWARVRTIALILLVPIMLVMVISTALGFEFIDAYTVKRALPRLAIAVILITLSFALTNFAIELFNTLGQGVQGIMLQPFGGEKSLNELVSQVEGITFSSTAGLVATGAFFAGIGLGVLFPLLLTAAIGIFLGFIVLIIRQVLLFFLIIIAPLAIVMWILPGTEKFWKLWWGNFSKLLFMFPLIMALLAAGNIAAFIIPAQQGGENYLTFILILVAFVAPFFFIPATFKAGGAFFGALAGATMGAFANQRKALRARAGRSAGEGWQRFKTGTGKGRLRNTNAVRRVGMGVGVGAKGRFGFGEQGREARALLGTTSAEETLKNNPALQKLGLTDDDGNAIMALSGGTAAGAEQASHALAASWVASGRYTAAEAEAARTRGLAAARSVGINRTNAAAALSTLAQNKSRAIAAGAAGRDLVGRGIDDLHQGNRAAADKQRQEFAFLSNQAGRGDLAGTNWADPDASLAGFERTGLYQAANGDANGVIGARQNAVALAGSHNPADRDRAARHYQELEAMLPNTSGPVRDAVLESMRDLRAAGIERHLDAPTGAVDPATGNPVMVDRRVLYDSNNPDHTGPASTWTPEEVARGWRNESRVQQRRDTLRSRSYRAPNPNEIP